MNHREQFWRWLIFGFRRLVLMVEEHAHEVEPTREQGEMLKDFARRMTEVASRAK